MPKAVKRSSRSEYSRLCGELDERVGAFLERPIEGDWPYLWIDATYVKTREAGRIVSVAVIVAVAVNTDGQRQVLGMKVGASEAEPFWTEFLRSLMRRGLRGVKLVISDSHEGIKAAASKVLKAMGAAERNDLLEVLDDRVGTRSTLITSQLPVKAWHPYLDDPTLADAILDRVVHSSHKIELRGRSLRDQSKPAPGEATPGDQA